MRDFAFRRSLGPDLMIKRGGSGVHYLDEWVEDGTVGKMGKMRPNMIMGGEFVTGGFCEVGHGTDDDVG